MATTLDTLVQRTRRFLRDYPAPVDVTTTSLSSSLTTVAIGDSSQVIPNATVEIDYETMLVRTVPNGTTFTVLRGWQGSTAVSHATTATVLIRAAFSTAEIVDALNSAMGEMYPYVYRPVIDTATTSVVNTYEYAVPNMPGTYNGDTIPMPAISSIEVKAPGDFAWRGASDWTVRRGVAPVIQFRRTPIVGGMLRVHGFGPFADLALSGDTLSAQFPKNAEQPLVLCAASRLLASAEAGRTRQDVGARDDREAANKPGLAISLAQQLERRFEKDLARVGLGPLPKHVVTSL